MPAHRMYSLSLLLTLGALTIAPASSGLQAQTTLDCKCSQSAAVGSHRSINGVVTVGAGLRIDMTPEWGARLETDVRMFGFEAGSVGWGLGIARRI